MDAFYQLANSQDWSSKYRLLLPVLFSRTKDRDLVPPQLVGGFTVCLSSLQIEEVVRGTCVYESHQE